MDIRNLLRYAKKIQKRKQRKQVFLNLSSERNPVFSVFYAVLPAYEILDPFAITISQQIKIHADKMADASTHNEQVENLVAAEVLWKLIKNRKL